MNKFFNKLGFDFQNITLNLVNELSLLLAKKATRTLHNHLTKIAILLIYVIAFTSDIEPSIAHSQSRDLPRWSLKLNLLPIIKYNMVIPLIDTISRIKMDMNFGFKISRHFISSPNKIYRGNRRVMRYLLRINRATSNKPLICFSKNWIERLLHIKVYYTVA